MMQTGHLKIVTEPASEPVTTDELKTYLNITGSGDNTLLGLLIIAARRACEEYTGRAFITQTWDYSLDDNDDPILIPRPPLQGATPYYTDMGDTEAAEDSDKFEVVTRREPGRILLKQGQTWETTRGYDGFRVRFGAGYGTSASNVPEGIKTAIKALAGFFYEHRGDAAVGDTLSDTADSEGLLKLCPVVALLLAPFRIGTRLLG